MSITPSSSSTVSVSSGSGLTTSTPRESPASSSRTSSTVTKIGNTTEEKILNRYTGILLADGSQKKLEVADHYKRLSHLRKEADKLEKSDWQYEPVEKLLVVCVSGSVRAMQTFLSGNDQFSLISNERIQRRSNSFQLVNDFVLEDTILEWDIKLYSQSSDDRKQKTWYVKGIETGPDPFQIFPPKDKLGWAGGTKAVISRKTVYILDLGTYKLFSVNLNQLLAEDFNLNLESVILSCTEIKFLGYESKSPTIVDISSSGQDCYAIDSEGGIYAVPKLLWRIQGVSFRSIHSGFSFSVLVSDTGAVYTWGTGSRGELGQRINSVECEAPKRVDFFDDLPSIVTSVVCGGWHSLALTSDGDIYSWGWNESGQLGHSVEKLSSITSDPYPIDLGSGEDPVTTIAAGARHSVAVLKSGRIYSWGFNKFGQLGLGDYSNHLLPTEVHLPHVTDFANVKRNFTVTVKCGRWTTLLQTKN